MCGGKAEYMSDDAAARLDERSAVLWMTRDETEMGDEGREPTRRCMAGWCGASSASCSSSSERDRPVGDSGGETSDGSSRAAAAGAGAEMRVPTAVAVAPTPIGVTETAV